MGGTAFTFVAQVSLVGKENATTRREPLATSHTHIYTDIYLANNEEIRPNPSLMLFIPFHL